MHWISFGPVKNSAKNMNFYYFSELFFCKRRSKSSFLLVVHASTLLYGLILWCNKERPERRENDMGVTIIIHTSLPCQEFFSNVLLNFMFSKGILDHFALLFCISILLFHGFDRQIGTKTSYFFTKI